MVALAESENILSKLEKRVISRFSHRKLARVACAPNHLVAGNHHGRRERDVELACFPSSAEGLCRAAAAARVLCCFYREEGGRHSS